MHVPRISIVIPVKNERAKIQACLDGIFSQTLAAQLEVIVVDSGSMDGTLEILARYPVTVEKIPPGEFNHGDTRNLGVRRARGEFVVMTVADAAAVDNRWLERMLEHFSDARVMGVCGQQIVPHEPDKNPLAWFRPCSEPEPRLVWFPEPIEFARLPGEKQIELCGWDDVTAIYRRAALLETPFRRASYCEDVLWARDALTRGWAIVYEPRAQVRHYHAENFAFRFRRTLTTQYFYHRFFGCRPAGKSLPLNLARVAYHLLKWKEVPWRWKPKWLAYNFSGELAEWLARHRFALVCHLRGDAAVDRLHERFCGRPPQPVKD